MMEVCKRNLLFFGKSELLLTERYALCHKCDISSERSHSLQALFFGIVLPLYYLKLTLGQELICKKYVNNAIYSDISDDDAVK